MVIIQGKHRGTLVALYGILRKNGSAFHDIDDEHVKHVGTYISEPKYTMYDIGSVFPAIIREGNTPITLELFSIDKLDFEDIIDEVMGYDILHLDTSLFTKHVIDTPFGAGFIYYYNRKIRDIDRKIESGDWLYNLTAFNKNTQLEYDKNII